MSAPDGSGCSDPSATDGAGALDADLALLIDAASAAGQIAMTFFRNDPSVEEKPGGQGPVSEADLAVERALHARLTAARPGYGWLSEEAPDDPTRLGCARVFVLDPIDGTRAFIAGERGFCIALALVERGAAVAGVVHLPARNETYAARRGGGARLNGLPLQTSARTALTGADMLISSAQLRPALWPGGAPPVTRHFRPALAHRLCLVASGRFDAFVTLRPTWEWDAAAGEIIAREAGAEVTDRGGLRARFNSASRQLDGMVVAPAVLHTQIMARLTKPASRPPSPD